ncbi:hypothetical protein B566_EDAN012300 [Ephemera danica]|nr:hypothetical protein B566_EDAN012300 [Ephemera danica]
MFPNDSKKLYIYTGNVLNMNEVKKKVGQTLTDEIVDSMRITVAEWQTAGATNLPDKETIQIRRNGDGSSLLLGVNEERKDLKVGLKLFLPSSAPSDNAIADALNSLLTELKTGHVESLVLAQAGRQAEGFTPEQQLQRIRSVWEQLQIEEKAGRVLSGGVSDVDTELFINLHTEAQVKPSIVQINLATCCVVPPALQAFAKEHEVQLLTHSDPLDVLPAEQVKELFGSDWHTSWILRSQVHVKCRGVLASKGYIACIEKNQ